jgi:alkylation response protein AidB-like acyl-CoA dehydrogenase
MKLSLDDEQLMLRESAARLVREQCGVEMHRRLRDEGRYFDPRLWAQLAELGWLGLPFSAADGGYDGSLVDIVVLMEELGRGLVVQPYLSTVLACGWLLARCDDDMRSRYLPGIISGETQWAFAFAESQGGYRLDQPSCVAVPASGAYLLSGTKVAVLNGALADRLLVTARLENGATGLFVVDDAALSRRRPVPLVDGSQGAEIVFDGVTADLLSADAVSLLEDVVDRLAVVLAAQGLGNMQALLEMTVDYCKTREQFGQPIGKFQALQHRMADMYMQCESLRSLLYDAAIAHQEGRADRARTSSALKVKLGEAGRFVAHQAVQLHGGMGMTDELAVGHHFKSLLLLNTLFGDADYHLDRYVALSA